MASSNHVTELAAKLETEHDCVSRERPAISAVVVTFHSTSGAAISLGEMAEIARFSHEVEWIIVDNSTDPYEVGRLGEMFCDSARVIAPSANLGFAGGVNAGALEASGEWLLLVNPDVHVTHEGMEELVRCVQRLPDSVKMASPVLETNGIVHQGIQFQWGVWFADRPVASALPLAGPTGGLAILRRQWFLKLGGLDEGFFAWGEDAEFALRAKRAGEVCRPLPVRFHHDGGHSVTNVAIAQKRAYSLARNRVRIVERYFGPRDTARFVLVWTVLLPARVVRNAKRRTTWADICGFVDGWHGQASWGRKYVW